MPSDIRTFAMLWAHMRWDTTQCMCAHISKILLLLLELSGGHHFMLIPVWML